MIENINNKFISNNGTENITIIHLKESIPFRYIKSVGWITSNIAYTNRRDLELETLADFIEAAAST